MTAAPEKPIAVPDGNGWGTHLPAVVHYVLRTAGPILELGAGLWSTPVLHAISARQGRPLVTAEADPAWLGRFADLRSDRHAFLTGYDAEAIDACDWSVVLIDHAMDRRQRDLLRLRRRARFLVCHDTNCVKYGWDFGPFRFRREWALLSPTVTVVSDVEQP